MNYINNNQPTSNTGSCSISLRNPRPRMLLSFSYLVFLMFLATSCEKILEVEDPRSLVQKNVVFQDNITANAAVTGMYMSLINSTNFASGAGSSVTTLASLSSDDFGNYYPSNVLAIQFYENELRSDNGLIRDLWRSAYLVIYQANSILSGLETSTGVTAEVKEELRGEALFMRAFCHFYLVNMFGEIPIALSTDYRVNTNLKRNNVEEVYEQTAADLLEAQRLLPEVYSAGGRIRPNKAVATAVLARVYLYQQDWENAETQSSLLIDNATYKLEDDVNNVFLATSMEAIWQLKPDGRYLNTWEGSNFIWIGYPGSYFLTSNLVASFEAGDERLANWMGTLHDGTALFYFPLKYKVNFGGTAYTPPIPVTEYSMVLRLAEQYLIRAEARTQLDNLTEAINDLDMIRDRAGLPSIQDTDPSITKQNLLLAIEDERRKELFTEWGHRWFDLKRTDRATQVLSTLKPNWSVNDLLYPIPATEFFKNPSMGDQNPGY